MRRLTVLLCICSITGCASTATWMHPNLANAPNTKDLATLAQAECEGYAQGRTPPPVLQSYVPVPQASTYNTTGTYSTYGSTGSFNATTTASGGFASGLAAGSNAGTQIANAYAVAAAQQRVRDITDACMRSLGWIDVGTPEGAAKFKLLTSTASTAPHGQTTTPAERASVKEAEKKWSETVNEFIDTEASRSGGIDYRKNTELARRLDDYVKKLASDPRNNDKTMLWFLVEADRLVKEQMKTTKRNPSTQQ